MRVIELARAGPGFLFEHFKKIESSQLMISLNEAVNHIMQESFGINLLINNQ